MRSQNTKTIDIRIALEMKMACDILSETQLCCWGYNFPPIAVFAAVGGRPALQLRHLKEGAPAPPIKMGDVEHKASLDQHEI